jgi:hypothetical protein
MPVAKVLLVLSDWLKNMVYSVLFLRIAVWSSPMACPLFRSSATSISVSHSSLV